MGKSPKLEREKKNEKNEKEKEKLDDEIKLKSIKQRKTYQSTSTIVKLYGDDFDDIIRAINHSEMFDSTTILTPELLEVYKTVYFDNLDFKNDIFFKNLRNFDSNVGNFDRERIPHTFTMDMENLQYLLNSIRTPNEMLDKYIEKAIKIDNNNNDNNDNNYNN